MTSTLLAFLLGAVFALGALAVFALIFLVAVAAAWWLADTVCSYIERG